MRTVENESLVEIFDSIVDGPDSAEAVVRAAKIEPDEFTVFIKECGLEEDEDAQKLLQASIRLANDAQNQESVSLIESNSAVRSASVAGTIAKADVLHAISEMSVMEVVELVEALEEKFGVTAAAAVAAAPVAGTRQEDRDVEQNEFDVVLTSAGDKKVNVIKVVRAVTGLGLKEAKSLVDGYPSPIKENASRDEAEDIKKQLEEAGASAEVK